MNKYIINNKVVHLPYLECYISTLNNKQELPKLNYNWEHKGFIITSQINIEFHTENLRRIIRLVNRKNKKGSVRDIYCSELLEMIL